jgi:hypothetical protein
MTYWTRLVSLSALLCAVEAAVTVYTATSATAIPQYTAASTDQNILQVPGAPANQAASVPIQLYDGGMDWLGLPVVGFSFRMPRMMLKGGT